MTAIPLLAPWHQDFPGRLAGSVYAAAPECRVDAARQLSAAGIDVHVDMLAEDEGFPAGVGIDELGVIAETVDPARIGVHLIGSTGFVDKVLPSVLAVGPGVVFLPWDAFTKARSASVRAAGAEAWIVLWREWHGSDHTSAPIWPATPDGVLVMLIEPGTRDGAALARLAVVTACAGDLPVAVDGGVTESVARLCATAGATSMVVGRALLANQTAAQQEGTS